MVEYYVHLEKDGKFKARTGPYSTKEMAEMMVNTYEAIYKDKGYVGKVVKYDD